MSVESISEFVEVVQDTAEVVKEITDEAKEYVGELMPPLEEWEVLDDTGRSSIVGEIFDRLVEIGFIEPTDQIKAIVDVFDKGTSADILSLAIKGGIIAAGTYFGVDLQTSLQIANGVEKLVNNLLEE